MKPNVARSVSLLSAALALCLATGCARYEFDVVRPADLAQHVGGKVPVSIPLDDLEYRLQSANGRLVVWVENPGETPVRLIGDDSVAVDPRGESHPVGGRTIAPGSRIKLILPPPRPQVRSYGPTFGVGVGAGFGTRVHRHYGYEPVDDDLVPRYYAVYDSNDATYWDWPGEGTARLFLAYERGPDHLQHEFEFRRRKM